MIAALFALALAAAPSAGPSQAATPCIQLSDSSDTHYHPIDDHTIIVESGRRWWRLATTPSPLMLQPQSFFVNDIRGASTLCSPLDFQLYVADYPAGFREPLIVQSFTAIGADEAKALRPRFVR